MTATASAFAKSSVFVEKASLPKAVLFTSSSCCNSNTSQLLALSVIGTVESVNG